MSTWNQGGGPPPVVPRPPAKRGPNVGLIVGIAAAVVAIGAGAAYLVLRPSGSDEPAQAAETTVAETTSAQQEAEDANARLMQAIPKGYPSGACEPVARLAGAMSTIACTVNKDPGGPMSATYSLLTGSAAPRDLPMHSGAGRVPILRMRPMSLAERSPGVASVSLSRLLRGGRPPVDGATTLRAGDCE